MTSYLAITTCNAAQWERFGRAMARTFCRHWPAEIPLWIYCESFRRNVPEISERLPDIDLDAEAPWLATWKAVYRDPRYNGGPNGRDYRHDAVRFAHKIAAIGAAAEDADCDVLIWMDADIVTHEPVTVEWLDDLFPEPATIAWLDRDNCYPECGYVMFRMPAARKVIREVVKAYRNGSIFNLPEWHDSFVLEYVVQTLKVPTHSLSGPEGRRHRGHPWIPSELASRMDHLKGEIRKAHGRSLKQDLKVPRSEPYWQ